MSRYLLEIYGEKAARRHISEVGLRAAVPDAVLLRATAVLAQGVHETFATHGQAIGQSWPAKKDGSPATLVDTGSLQAQIANMQRVTKTQAIASIRGPESYIARFHQGGTKRGLPARPVVGIPPATRSVLLAMVEHYVVGGRP